MNPIAAIAIGGAAVVLVILYNKQKETTTAAMIANINSTVYHPGAVGFADLFNVAGTVVSTYIGGPGAGAAFAKGIR